MNSYVEIEKIRFPNLFDVAVDVEPEVMGLIIIKIILQPLVENAIHHGFSGIDHKGRISIRGFIPSDQPETVVFQIGLDFESSPGRGTVVSFRIEKGLML